MDNQNTQNTGPILSVEAKNKKSKLWLSLAILLVFAGFFAYENYFGTEARSSRETQKNYQKYLDWEKSYNEAMENDTYGGKTPQETLDMFVEALRAGDTELASKYFVLKEDEKIDQKWIDLLKDLKDKNNLERFADDIGKYNNSKEVSESYFVFIYKNEDGSLGLQLVMIFNKQSGVWKIESL